MRSKKIIKTVPPPLAGSNGDADEVQRTAGNATRQLDKPGVRRKAHADQATLQDEGTNALPVSDYPLKVGSVAPNSIDAREQKRLRRRG